MSANDEVHPDGVGAVTSRPGGTIPTDAAQSTMTNDVTGDMAGDMAGDEQGAVAGTPGANAPSTTADAHDQSAAGEPNGVGGSAAPGNSDSVANPAEPNGSNGPSTSSGEGNEYLGVGAPYPRANHQPQSPQPPAPQPPRAQPGQQAASNNQTWRPADRPVPGRAPAAAPGQGQPQPGAWSSRPDSTPPSSPTARRRGGESPLTEWQSSPPNVGRRSAPNPPPDASAQAPAGAPAPAQVQPGAAQGGAAQAGGAAGGSPPGPTPGGAAYGSGAPPQSGLPDQNHWEDDPIGEQARRMVPKYGVRGALFRITKLNLGPTRRDLDELEIRERLNRQTRRTRGYCGYIGIGSEKGGVGKTTLASLLAAEIAEGRRESVGIADLNPDLGTLPDRFGVRPHYSIRDLLAHVDEIPWRYHVHDFMEKVPEMNVRVLAASTDRKIRHQLSVSDVELLAELFAPFFSFAILDNGTHITHEAMLGTLRTAHGLVLVTDNTRDGANLARKTLQFLTDNGYPEMRRRAVVAVVAKETASPIKVRAIEKAFRDHVRDLVVVPYDAALDGGGKIPFRDPNAVNKLLRKDTRMAVRRLAAIVMDDLVS